MINKIKTAFSLIELSIVILIIGILVAGVTQSSRLVRAIKLQSARSITTSSPVTSIKNLTMWYETTLEKSIDEAERQDGIEVSKWYDVNPTSVTKNDATQVTLANRPKFTDNMINGLPALKFDGVVDYLDYNGTLLVGTEYTVFVVEQRRSNADGYFIGGGSLGLDMCLSIGYYNGVNFRHTQFADSPNDCLNCFSAYTSPTPRLHIMRQSITDGRRYYLNNSSTITAQNTIAKSLMVSYNSAYIGRLSGSTYYNGDIGEIIVFSSALKADELTSIKDYLAKKWGIKVT
jgi:prepilin-type N-terminal cleavage/methylation domain-containing protein